MPIYEYVCADCGAAGEHLVMNQSEAPRCDACGSGRIERQLSRPADYAGMSRNQLPGDGDTDRKSTRLNSSHYS